MFLSTWRMLARNARRKVLNSRGGRQLAAHIRKWPVLWLEPLEDRTLLSTFQWTGSSGLSSNWNDPNNWTLVSGTVSPRLSKCHRRHCPVRPAHQQSSTVQLNTNITVGEVDFGTATNITIYFQPATAS